MYYHIINLLYILLRSFIVVQERWDLYGVILELHIRLEKVKPTVWRTIHIHREATFKELHHVIQLLFDWWDTYPYQFIEQNKDYQETILDKQSHREWQPSNKVQIKQAINERKLTEQFKQQGDRISYEYGSTTCWKLSITLQNITQPRTDNTLYPFCKEAQNEIVNYASGQAESTYFPFGVQKSFHQENLVNQLNKKITDNTVQYSIAERKHYTYHVWDRLKMLTNEYYKQKPWQHLTNQQVIAIYDGRFDQYLFCSVLGKENGLFGLSVYIGFNGLLSLHTSLTKKLSIEQLFHLHANLLLRFEKETPSSFQSSKGAPDLVDENIRVHYTSYEPGYYPWKIDEKEASMIVLALEYTLKLYEKMKLGFSIPNYIDDDTFYVISTDSSGRQVKQTLVTFEDMVKKVLPLQITLSDRELRYLKKMKQQKGLVVEFSLQYIDVPIQRLKEHRPFLPLSSIIVNQKSKQLLYHNVYNDRLNHTMVQSEFMQMITLLQGLPEKILTDELTYHYLKPLLLLEDFPVNISNDLHITNELNKDVSEYLLSNYHH